MARAAATGSLANIVEYYKNTKEATWGGVDDSTTVDERMMNDNKGLQCFCDGGMPTAEAVMEKGEDGSPQSLSACSWTSVNGQLLQPYAHSSPVSLGIFVCEVNAHNFGIRTKFPVGELFSRVRRVLNRECHLCHHHSTKSATFMSNDEPLLEPRYLYFNDQSGIGRWRGGGQTKSEELFQLQCVRPRCNSFGDKANTFLKVLKDDPSSYSSNVVVSKQQQQQYKEYIQAVNHVHRQASARSMYDALRHGASVCAGDFKRILTVSEELEARLDVSIMSATKLKALRTGRGGGLCGGDGSDDDDFDQRFAEVLADYLGPIKPATGYYLYWYGVIGETHYRGEKYELFSTRTISTLEGGDTTSTTKPDIFYSFPTLVSSGSSHASRAFASVANLGYDHYKADDDDDDSDSQLPSSVPGKVLYEILPPMFVRFELRRVSKDGKLIKCVQLDEARGYSEALLCVTVDGAHEDDQTFLIMFLSTFPEVTSAKTISLQEELTSTILSNIDALMNAEVLRLLLDVTPVTLDGLDLVKKCLSPLPQSEMLQFCYPIHLVYALPELDDNEVDSPGNKVHLLNMERDIDILLCELLKDTSLMTFRRVGDSLIVVEPYFDGTVGYKIPYWAILTVVDDPNEAQEVVEYCEGTKTGSSTVMLYTRVTIHLHNLFPGVVDTLRETICQAIAEAGKNLNRRLLLHRLHETKYASSLLIPPDPELEDHHQSISVSTGGGDGAAAAASDEMKQLVAADDPNVNHLRPGCLSCSLKFRHQFPLYDRIRDQVLERLQGVLLEGFVITNRRMMYVYRDSRGSIFYLSLVKEVIAASSSATSVVGHEKREKEKSLLVLSAYGVDEVEDGVAFHLTRVIEQKLAEYNYRFLSDLLERNSMFHLTPLDMEVVTCGACINSGRGLEAAATCGGGEVGGDDHGRETAYLFLPKSIQDVSLFFLYLRQSICAGELVNPLFTTKPETEMAEEDNNAAAAFVSDNHRHHNENRMDREAAGLSSGSKRSTLMCRLPATLEESETIHDIDNNNTSPPPPDGGLLTPEGFTFYINLSHSDLSGLGPVTQRPAQSIGKGIAIIHLSPINAEGKVEWDLLPGADALSTLCSQWKDMKMRCEDEIRNLKEEVLDPLNSGLNFHPGLACPLREAVTTTTSSSSIGRGTELDIGTEGQQQQGGGLASRQQQQQHLRKSKSKITTSKRGPSCCRYGVNIEVDACGAIDLPNLLNLMERYIDQALVDYWIERILLVSQINSMCSEEEASIISGIRTASSMAHTLEDDDGLDNHSSSTIEHRPELPSQGCDNDELVICSASPTLGSSKDDSGGQHQANSGDFCHTTTHHVTNAGRNYFPFADARMCSSLGELLHSGEHLGNPTVRRVSLCEALPDWALSRVLEDSMVALSSCLQATVDTTLLSFDMNGSCEVVSGCLDKQSMRMLSSPEQPKSFVAFFGLQFPNCETLSLIDRGESALEQQQHLSAASSPLSQTTTTSSSSYTNDYSPDVSLALFPWVMEAELVKEKADSFSLSIDEGGGSSEKIRIDLDYLWKEEYVVLQRRVLLVLHLSCRVQTLEAYNLHHLHAGRVYEALFSVLSAAKLQKLALEHVVCQNAGRLPPFSSLYPRTCSRVGVGAEQHHMIKLPRLPPMKQTKKQPGLSQPIQAIRLYPEPLKRIVSHASTDSIPFNPKLWEVIFAEPGRMTRVFRGGAASVPGSAHRKPGPEGGLTRDGSSRKSIVAAATASSRHRARPSSARIATALSGGGSSGGVGPQPSCIAPRLSCYPPSSSDSSSTVNDEGYTRFMVSPSLCGRSSWRRYVEHLVAAPMLSPLRYALPDMITMKMTTTLDHHPLFHHHHCCLPIVPIAKHMETLKQAVSEEKFEANSLSKMISYTWEGLQTLRWKPPARSNNNKDHHQRATINVTSDEEEVWKIPSTMVAESLAKHARLLGVMVFPLPMVDADAAVSPPPPLLQDPLLSTQSTSNNNINAGLGCCHSQQCRDACTETLSGSHGIPLHGGGGA